MAESVFGPGLDMEDYLARRALEIPDLAERKLFKDVVEKMLVELYRYTKAEYAALESRVFGELQSPRSDYAVYIGLTDRAHYDAADPFLHPMILSDTETPTYAVEELQKSLRSNKSYPLYSIFLETDYQTVLEFSVPGHVYHGTVFTEHGQYRATCTVQPNRVYCRQIEGLYQIFTSNSLPWSTVCTAYLHKFFQVDLIAVENIDPKETIQEVRVDFEGYAAYVRYHCFPLWNLEPVSEKTSTYPEPCMDRTNYDHRIFAHRLMGDRPYLVANTDVEITNIRRLEGDLIVTCPAENPHPWVLYRIDRPSGQSHTPYPVLSNRSRESFAGNLSDRYRRGIKTKAEISRILASYSYEDYVELQNVTLEASADARCQTYPMDGFILDELRTEKAGMTMLLTFSSKQPDHFLTLDVMSFLVSQVQSLSGIPLPGKAAIRGRL